METQTHPTQLWEMRQELDELRGVNAALVAALREMERLIDAPVNGGWHYDMARCPEDTVERVRAALALVEDK